jgi:hypothetical protein
LSEIVIVETTPTASIIGPLPHKLHIIIIVVGIIVRKLLVMPTIVVVLPIISIIFWIALKA